MRQRHFDDAAQALAEALRQHDAEQAVAVAPCALSIAFDADPRHDAKRHTVRQGPLADHAQRGPYAFAAEGARAAVEFRRGQQADRRAAAGGVDEVPAQGQRGVAVAGVGAAPAARTKMPIHAPLGLDAQLDSVGDAETQHGGRGQDALAPRPVAVAFILQAGFELETALAHDRARFDEVGPAAFDDVLGLRAGCAQGDCHSQHGGVLHGMLARWMPCMKGSANRVLRPHRTKKCRPVHHWTASFTKR